MRIIYILILQCFILQTCAQYNGGNGDGSSEKSIQLTSLGGYSGTIQFISGINDGWHAVQTPVMFLNGSFPAMHCKGGIADGSSHSNIYYSSMDGFNGTIQYASSINDGWHAAGKTQIFLNGDVYAVYCKGGVGDGTDKNELLTTALITLTSCTLNLKVFIEGMYAGNGMMQTVLYNSGLNTDPEAADSVEVALWSPGSSNNTHPDYVQHALLKKNGDVTAVFPPAVIGGTFYIAIRHRNSIATWSRIPLQLSGLQQFNFTY